MSALVEALTQVAALGGPVVMILLLFALMAAGLFVTMAPRPSAGATIQVGRSLCVLAVLWRLRPGNFRNFQRIFQRLGRPRRAPRPACRRTRAASPG